MRPRIVGATLGIALVIASSTALAQQPTELKADAAQDSSGNPDSGFVAKLRRIADETKIIERLNGDIDGWYPRLGGMTRGGGFALGPGYRTHLFDDRIFVDLSTGLSIKGYKASDVNVRWLKALGDRVELWTDFRYEDFPQEDYFGRGPDSSLARRTSYDFDSSDFVVRGLVKPVPWFRVGTSVGYMQPSIGPGSDRRYPSLEQIFADADAPGLVSQPDFLHTTIFSEVDYRDVRGNPRSGGFYHASFGIWDDRTLQRFDFRRLDVRLMQYVPVVADKSHMIVGRLGSSYANNETGERVPFYFLPYVGGVDTIRGFREFRFKDENAMWMSVEYNWRPIKWVSFATFFDAGEVRPDWGDIDFHDLKTAYRFGIRAHSRTQNFARIDVGTGGGEGWTMFLKLGPSF